eukprot:TRINITY_DN18556_c0_g1_i8.p1 TRINITY_DN18556_c0_g1~~TRINITY_DN18556_c0_g1_i8.p1  ORF type:complete len:156 (+),score=25.67 TRINITY_DN18556_c0_g1_i8:160-627(+)
MCIRDRYLGAVQIALEKYPQDLSAFFISSIKGKISQLSITKYSSNVVERCLEYALPSLQTELIEEIMEHETLLLLMKNNFGNYVLQKALSLAGRELRERLAIMVKLAIPYLQNKKMKQKWNQALVECLREFVQSHPSSTKKKKKKKTQTQKSHKR